MSDCLSEFEKSLSGKEIFKLSNFDAENEKIYFVSEPAHMSLFIAHKIVPKEITEFEIRGHYALSTKENIGFTLERISENSYEVIDRYYSRERFKVRFENGNMIITSSGQETKIIKENEIFESEQDIGKK